MLLDSFSLMTNNRHAIGARTSCAIAQTKPASWRAIAVVTVVIGFPARLSLRYWRQSRSWAFQAIARIGAVSCSWRSNCYLLMRAGNR